MFFREFSIDGRLTDKVYLKLCRRRAKEQALVHKSSLNFAVYGMKVAAKDAS